MSNVSIVDPLERLDRVEFSGEREWRDHAVQLGAYTCPRCGMRYCGVRCAAVHTETRCLKFTVF